MILPLRADRTFLLCLVAGSLAKAPVLDEITVVARPRRHHGAAVRSSKHHQEVRKGLEVDVLFKDTSWEALG